MRTRIHLASWSDEDLERGFAERVRRDRALTAEVLVFLGEMMARRLFGPAGYTSMYQYCVRRCGMSADVAFKWTRAARLARRFPVLLDMIEDGRTHLTAVTMLAAHLDDATAPWLLPAAAGKSTRELQLLLAQHWPRPDAPTVIKPLAARREAVQHPPSGATVLDEQAPKSELAARPVSFDASKPAATTGEPPHGPAMPPMSTPAPAAPVAPPAPALAARSRYLLQCTLDQEAVELLERARALAPHGSGTDVAVVLKAALRDHLELQEKRRFAATRRPREPRVAVAPEAGRRIAAHIKRAVWKRDGGRCTFVAEDGTCCGARESLEFDHIVPVARGGTSTEDNLRLRCRTHNQLEADRAFGKGFMDGKRPSRRRRPT